MNDLGSLSQCLVESDAEAIGRAHRLRRKALALSMILELLVVAVLLLWPLLMPAAIPGLYMVTPLPPYHGTASAHKSEAAAARPAAARNLSPANSKAFWQPKQIPSSAKPMADAPQKFADSPVDITNLLPGSGPGTYIDGGGDTATRMIQIPPPPAKPRAAGISGRGAADAFVGRSAAARHHRHGRVSARTDPAERQSAARASRHGRGARMALPPDATQRAGSGRGNLHHREFRDGRAMKTIERQKRRAAGGPPGCNARAIPRR